MSMTVNGEAVSGDDSFAVVDPARGEECGRAPLCSPQQLDDAMAAAEAAADTWSTSDEDRRRTLRRAAATIDEHGAELATILTTEQGKPLGDARAEVARCVQWLEYFADVELAEPPAYVAGEGAELVRRPLGVVAAITPWNAPLMLACWKLGPALRAGNTVVLKPSPFTPLSTLRMGELLAPVMPPGVVNVVSGGDELGAQLTNHPVPRKISFTGSVPTGKKVAVAAAADLKRVTLELGGNDPALVLDDADPAAIADALFWSAFRNCGQVCSAVKRVYVPEALHDRLVDELARRARAVRVGPGFDDGVELGPVNNAAQLARVEELVDDARHHGATVAAGGIRLRGAGLFYAPTVLTGVGQGIRVVDEEQFGPVVPVVAYRDVEDAVAQANATHFGLSASVWGTDGARAAEVGARLQAGRVGMNVHPGISPDVPFGGWKWSGIGLENGLAALHEYTQLQVVYGRASH
jgi:acyl-CoA reductase-like NAD-dependent aldehyde dehydrogenase